MLRFSLVYRQPGNILFVSEVISFADTQIKIRRWAGDGKLRPLINGAGKCCAGGRNKNATVNVTILVFSFLGDLL